MIPKVIHYCWFGGNPLPKFSQRCIASWKKYLPEYEIKEWNENNFDLSCCAYVKEAYKARKWAFVSDYARFWILYHEGGLYFDTDVEIINPLDNIIEKGPFIGCEETHVSISGKNLGVNPGLGLAAAPGLSLYKEILNYYESIHFSCGNGVLETVVDHTTALLRKHGWVGNGQVEEVNGVYIYPPKYFCPYSYLTGKWNITEHTVSIHHYAATWHSPLDELIIKIERCDRGIHPIEYKVRRGVSLPFRIANKVKNSGIKGVGRVVLNKIRR